MTYNRLGLPFTSPLVNIYWDRDQYSLFIQDPLFYLNTELQMVSDGDIKKGIWPIGKLGDVERTVSLQFTHSISFADAKEQWDRRKTRINPNNLFVKMGFASNVSNEKNKCISIHLKLFYTLEFFFIMEMKKLIVFLERNALFGRNRQLKM